jgi:hypothetical protein
MLGCISFGIDGMVIETMSKIYFVKKHGVQRYFIGGQMSEASEDA